MTEEYDEPLLIKTVGGPHHGTRTVTISQYGWPLPDILEASGGQYIKRSESELGPIPKGSHVIRGAKYEWEEK